MHIAANLLKGFVVIPRSNLYLYFHLKYGTYVVHVNLYPFCNKKNIIFIHSPKSKSISRNSHLIPILYQTNCIKTN